MTGFSRGIPLPTSSARIRCVSIVLILSHGHHPGNTGLQLRNINRLGARTDIDSEPMFFSCPGRVLNLLPMKGDRCSGSHGAEPVWVELARHSEFGHCTFRIHRSDDQGVRTGYGLSPGLPLRATHESEGGKAVPVGPCVTRRSLGLWMATALVIGNMIGSPVFLLRARWPRMEELASSPGCSPGTGAVALVFSRLGRAFPKTGVPYAYSRRAFGDFIGFPKCLGSSAQCAGLGPPHRNRPGSLPGSFFRRRRIEQVYRRADCDCRDLDPDGNQHPGSSGKAHGFRYYDKYLVPLFAIGVIGIFSSPGPIPNRC